MLAGSSSQSSVQFGAICFALRFQIWRPSNAQLKERQELQLLALEVRALEQHEEPDPRDVIRQRLIAAGVLCEAI